MKKLLLLVLLSVLLNAYTYNDKLLQIYAKITPRIVMMTAPLNGDAASPLHLCVLYKKGDLAAAKKLKKLTESYYRQGLRDRPVKVTLQSYSEHVYEHYPSIFFLLDGDIETIQQAIAHAKKMRIPTIAYSNRFLPYGVIYSLHIGKVVKPYINLDAAEKNGMQPSRKLLQISKIYSRKEDQ